MVGPGSTLLLRRLPALWVARVPAEIDANELSQSLGLGAGVGEHSRLMSTLERLARFGLARPATDRAGLDVFRQVPPLSARQLARVPQWTRDAHERLFSTHLGQIDRLDRLDRHQASVASVTARLDRLQQGTGQAAKGQGLLGQALGR